MHCKDAPRYVSRKFHKSPAKQFLEAALNMMLWCCDGLLLFKSFIETFEE